MDDYQLSPGGEGEAPREGTLRVDVVGKSADLWARLRPKLLQAISQMLDTVIDLDRGSTVRDEAKKFTSALLRHAEARLEKPVLENEKIEAEVAEIYAKVETERAQARKINAEAEAQELRNCLTRLKLVLMLAKAAIAGDEGDESLLLLGSQLDVFVKSIDDLSSDLLLDSKGEP